MTRDRLGQGMLLYLLVAPSPVEIQSFPIIHQCIRIMAFHHSRLRTNVSAPYLTPYFATCSRSLTTSHTLPMLSAWLSSAVCLYQRAHAGAKLAITLAFSQLNVACVVFAPVNFWSICKTAPYYTNFFLFVGHCIGSDESKKCKLC